ncbi:MAG: acyltransferase family protein [Propionibacteriaceae bacterium]|nr:acyltransferase family protein [Propionibacteriaceae bacterium]
MAKTNGGVGNRRLDIQGLRAVAVLVVVIFHGGMPLYGGFIGVDVFFVISGFVITAMLLRELDSSGRVDFKRFYIKRFKRLLPALGVLVGVTLLAAMLLSSPMGVQQTTALTGIGAVLLSANLMTYQFVGGYFDAPAQTNPLLHIWSLSVEEQFYLAFPAVIALAWAAFKLRGRGRGAAGWAVLGVTVATLLLTLLPPTDLAFPGSGFLLSYYSPLLRVWEFGAGSLLAFLPWAGPKTTRGANLLGIPGAAIALASFVFMSDAQPWPSAWTIVPVVGTVMVILSAGGGRGAIGAALSWQPAVKVGDWSYSLYLWHWPFVVFAIALFGAGPLVAPLAALACFLPAYMSFRYLEEPLRRKKMSGRGLLVAVLVTIGVPLLIGVLLIVGTRAHWWSAKVSSLAAAVEPFHAGAQHGCDLFRSPGEVPSGCTWQPEAAGVPIYLVGDSNADHIVEGVIGAGEELGRRVTSATGNACPFVDGQFADNRPGWGGTRCQDYVAASLRWFDSAPAGTVVISNSDVYFPMPEIQMSGPSGELTDDTSEKLDGYGAAMRRTVERLVAAGHEVLVVQTVPHWLGDDAWDPATCSNLAVLTDRCSDTMTTTEVLQRQSGARQQLEPLAALPGVQVWDSWPSICPGGTCTTQGDGFVTYRDSKHLSVPMARTLSNDLARALNETF